MSLVTRIVTTHPFGYFKSILNILLRFTSLHPRTNTLVKPGVWVWVRHIDYRMKVFLEEDTSIDYFTAWALLKVDAHQWRVPNDNVLIRRILRIDAPRMKDQNHRPDGELKNECRVECCLLECVTKRGDKCVAWCAHTLLPLTAIGRLLLHNLERARGENMI